MAGNSEDIDADKLYESNKESFGKLRSMVDELKSVEEHEKNLVTDEKTPTA